MNDNNPYVMKIAGYNKEQLLGEYNNFNRDINESLDKFFISYNNKNSQDSKYSDFFFLITPEIGINTIIMEYCYNNKIKIKLFIPEYKTKSKTNDIILLSKILKENYSYNNEQIKIINKMIIDFNLIDIINTVINFNILGVLWFGDTEISAYKQIINAHKNNIPIYDIYNLEKLKEEYII